MKSTGWKATVRLGLIVLAFTILSSLLSTASRTVTVSPTVILLFIPLFVCSVLGIVFYGIARSTGWPNLVKSYRQKTAFTGDWFICRTCHMSHWPVTDPTSRTHVTRLNFVIRVGTTADYLYLSTLPVLNLLVPTLQIPWSAIIQARSFTPPGWTDSLRGAGTVFQITYDPGYTGAFLELEIADTGVFLQLPADSLGDARAHLKISPLDTKAVRP